MLARKHLFTPGPTNMPEEIRRACDRPLEDHRAPDFPALVEPLFKDLKKVFCTQTGEVLVFAGSGTLGWEAALTNTLSPGDKILTASYGHFSDLWIAMCRDFGFEVEVIEGVWGEGAPVDDYAAHLAADKNHEIKAILACHNETATGVTSDIGALRKAIDGTGHPALLMVDGVSSIASLEFRMDDWGVDVAVCGSQKGFMLPTGLAIVGVSQKALAAADGARCGRNFADFKSMLKSNQTGYFPYTPAVTLLHGLKESCRLLLEEGLENVHARHHRLGEGVRQAVNAWGLTTCAKERRWNSDTVTAIVVPEGADSGAVIKAAYENYHLSLGGGLSKVAGKVFRIGHMGAVDDIMMLSALAGVEMALADAGITVELGSGVAAAQAYYRETR
ncbi:aminotransferase class V-fold PLP-dependent enzyme [Aestuariispira ectoiniformans]|uniref:aminotransferase class V-fold PLP-dependent enzyme n=1 Tax=Aestuariispira ectoiniformans TaxID=2775080 RepID=UPI00223A711E|nr:aminotransferase class V-fold PLP-dependent enzyme [Aestuariispira ectoiniformans]